MTATKRLQRYADEIYGEGFYKVEYQAFQGFYARSLNSDIPPHSQFLGISEAHSEAKLDENKELMEVSNKVLSQYKGEFNY